MKMAASSDGKRLMQRLDNATIDVAIKGCFGRYDTVACIRSSVLSVLVTVTFLLCLFRILSLHYRKHSQVHQYIIFYCSAIECILCGVNWALSSYLPQFDYAASFLKLLTFIVVCHWHWSLATRILHKETLVNRIILPILGIYFVYFTCVALFGIATIKTSWVECLEPEWLMLSAAEFFTVQLYLMAGIYITRKINTVSTIESFKRAQKRDLWSLIGAFEISAMCSVAYDLSMKLMGDEEMGCSGIFGHEQSVFSSIFALFMVFKFLLPVWVMLCVFIPIPPLINTRDGILSWAFGTNTSTSVFSSSSRDPHKPFRHHNQAATLGGSLVDRHNDVTFRTPASSNIIRSQSTPVLKRSLPSSVITISEDTSDRSSQHTRTSSGHPSVSESEPGDDQPLLKPHHYNIDTSKK